MSAMFRSLSGFNYRVWAAGALVSNVGTWMQRTAQDWIVLTQLTDNDAVALGITMALQFGPQLVLLPITGLVADRFDKRMLLMTTQAVMGILGLALGILTLTGVVQLWHVYVFAALLGCAAAFDAPVRQTFVSELVEPANLTNAVALNSASFNGARLIGPAVAGLLVALVGAGWVFLINALTFAAVMASLHFLRTDALHREARPPHRRGDLIAGFRYVAKRPDLVIIFTMIFLVGTFGMNFPIFASTMAVEFGQGAGEFGVLSSALAVGAVVGALLAARQELPRKSLLLVATAMFGVGCTIAAVMPTYWAFALVLPLVGISAQTFMTTANSTVQLSTDPEVRGRVMAIYMAIFMGGTPIGAPIVGWVANEFGPRWALGVGAASGFAAAFAGVVYLVRYRGLRLHRRAWRLGFTMDDRDALRTELAADEVAASR